MKVKLTLEEFTALAYESLRNRIPQSKWPDKINPEFITMSDRNKEQHICETIDYIYINLPDQCITIYNNEEM